MKANVRKTVISALVAGLVVLMAPAAHADTLVLTDPAGDVMTATMNDNFDVVKYNREGGAEGDIVSARIQHTATQIVMFLRYRQLTVPRQYAMYQYVLEGNNHQMALISLDTRKNKPQGNAYAGGTGARRCAMSHHINYGADWVSVRIARGCLKKAKYVRLTQISYQLHFNETLTKILYDNPARDGGTMNQVYAAHTPWVVTG